LFLKKFADPNFILSGKFVQNFFSELPMPKIIVLNKNKDRASHILRVPNTMGSQSFSNFCHMQWL
jgi:hypothetical protein